jgi:hypothetical protein
MTTYTAYFYTDGAYASTEIEASNPQKALEKAIAINELRAGNNLIFNGLFFHRYDEAQPVNHIEILDEDRNEFAHWYDADMHLRITAPQMLSLLKRINEAFYINGTRKALLPVMRETKLLIARAEGR